MWQPQFGHSALRKCTAVLFVVLMAGFGFVQAVHVHDALSSQSSPASHCSLCVVAHSAAVTSPVNAAPAPAIETATLDLSVPQLRSQLQVPSTFIRPPPSSL